MAGSKLLQQISKKDSDKEAIAAKVIDQPELLAEIFEGLNADRANIKYGCDKILRLISEKAPAVLYPKFDFFYQQLEQREQFFQRKLRKIYEEKTLRNSRRNGARSVWQCVRHH